MTEEEKEKKPIWSSFWLDDGDDEESYLPFDEDLVFEAKDSDLDTGALDFDTLKLASGRRAISNFVNILTGEDIPVYFYSGDTGQTDGKVVYLSADIVKKEDFDPAVGLALHEGSHIVLTDFELIKTLWGRISELYKLGKEIGFSKERVREFTQIMVNYVEDRYIDDYVFRTAPGYRPYYVALYEKYFNNEEISKVLKTNKLLREPTLPAYECRIINFTNPYTDLNALPGLRKIAEKLSLKNISRLKTTKDRIKIAIEITKIVFQNIKQYIEDKKQQGLSHDPDPNQKSKHEIFFDIRVDDDEKRKDTNKNEEEKPSNKEKSSKDGRKNKGYNEDNSSEMTKNLFDENDVIGGEESSVETIESKKKEEDRKKEDEEFGDNEGITKKQLKKIKIAIEVQKQFLDNHRNVDKKKVSDKQKQILDAIEKSGIILVPVGTDIIPSNGSAMAVDCIVVKKLTKELIFSNLFPFCKQRIENGKEPEPMENVRQAVIKGIQLGKQLGKKLQIRQEINTTIYPRRRNGKVLKRHLHEFFNGSDAYFYKSFTDKYDKLNIHICVDASGSMSEGGKWEKTMTMLVALAKAGSMIDNLRVCISFRSTIDQIDGNKNSPYISQLPYIVLAYDSAKDKFSKIKNLFPYLNACGATPEGLCFEAVMKQLVCNKPGEIYYFLNISDGEPCFSYYGPGDIHIDYGMENGAEHTRKQYRKILESGVKGISYFIESARTAYVNTYGAFSSTRDAHVNCFKKMYGKDAKFIDVNNVTSIAKTMNELFLNKDS